MHIVNNQISLSATSVHTYNWVDRISTYIVLIQVLSYMYPSCELSYILSTCCCVHCACRVQRKFSGLLFRQAVNLYDLLAPKSFSLAPKNFIWSLQYFCNLNFLKHFPRNFIFLLGKWRTESTRLTSKSSNPGLLDITFFAHWSPD